jgi:hypothetical protein
MAPDRTAHGNMDAVPYFLQQLRAREVQTGKRILDVLSLHYYPQVRSKDTEEEGLRGWRERCSSAQRWF